MIAFMKPLALITGASAGIGKEMAGVAARDGYDLLLVARRESALRECAEDLERQYDCTASILTCDLSEESGWQSVLQAMDQEAARLEVVVNNAGFGAAGRVCDLEWARQHKMIELNITALVCLSRSAAKAMEARGHGYIMNVASTAAFQAGPLMSIYYASKAFVLHFTEGLAEEMKPSGVIVSCLCPGPTESEFIQAAQMEKPIYFKGPIPTSAEVAAWGWQAMKNGKVVAVHSLKNQILVTLSRFIPRWLIRKVTHYLNGTK
jgi:short-subunit dehydrogenase